MKLFTPLKKGVSEPNLNRFGDEKTINSNLFFGRSFLKKMKKVFPRSFSRHSLNEKSLNKNDVEGSISSSSSELSEDFRIFRLDQIHQKENFHRNQIEETFPTIFSYFVHLIADFDEQNDGRSAVCHFKFPFDAEIENSLKYFSFPEWNFSSLNLKPEFFRFTLTDKHGRRQHGYCSRFVRKSSLNNLCLISPLDFFEFYGRILTTATELFLSYKDDEARHFLTEIYPHRIPAKGDTVYLPTTSLGLYKLHCESDWRKTTIDSNALLDLSTGKNEKITFIFFP